MELYHATAIKNLKSIEECGIEPQINGSIRTQIKGAIIMAYQRKTRDTWEIQAI
jgi:hypothetical protein